jgi:hypothetical protein
MKRFETGIVVLTLVLHLFVAFAPADSLMHWYRNDDAFYYFKVAVNFINGHGMSFDGINLSNGFQPLWEVVCIAVFWTANYSLILPLRLMVIVSALLNAGTAIFIFRILRTFIPAGTAAIPAILWLFLPFIHTTVVQNGLEAGLSVFLIAFLIHLAIKLQKEDVRLGHLVLTGMAAGLAILARLDNIFVVALVGVWFTLGPVPAYLRTVITGDLAIIFIAGLMSNFIGLRTGKIDLAASAALPWLVGLAFVIQPVLFFLFKVYKPTGEKVTWRFFARIVCSTILASAMISIVSLILQRIGIITTPSFFLILINMISGSACFISLRLLARFFYGNEGIESLRPFSSWKFWKLPFTRALGYFLPVLVLLGGYMVWSFSIFGTPMPVSGQIKYWWGTLYSSFYGSVLTRDPSVVLGSNAWSLAMMPLRTVTEILKVNRPIDFLPALVKIGVAVLLLTMLLSQRKWVILLIDQAGLFAVLAGLYAQIFSYTSTLYWDTSNWYWVNQTLFTILFLGVLLEIIHLNIKKIRWFEKIWQVSLGVMGASCLVSFVNMVLIEYPYSTPPAQEDVYLTRVHLLEANTTAGDLIGIKGGGEMGYFIQDRTMVNLDGLINSYEYFLSLRNGRGTEFLDKLGLDYVIGYDYMLATSPYREALADRLIAFKPFGAGETLYRYVLSP